MLLRSPELAQQVLSCAGVAVAVVDPGRPQLPFVAVNEAFARLAGAPEGGTLQDTLAPSPACDELAGALAGGRAWTGVVRWRDRPGEVGLHADALDDGGGVAVIVRDARPGAGATEHLTLVDGPGGRAPESLAAAELRYRELVERIPAVVYIAELRGGRPLLYVSPQIEALSGHPPAAFLADHQLWPRLIDDADRDRVARARTPAPAGADRLDIEYRLRAADGTRRWVSERAGVVRDVQGRPRFMQGVLIDVTVQHEAAERMRRERDRAQRYLDLTEMVVVVVDPDGRIEMLNRAGHELLGREDGTLIGRDWFDSCVAPEERVALRERFAALAGGRGTPGPESYESQLVTADGDVRIVSWTTTVLRDGDGRLTSLLSSGGDVTERRHAERQIAHLAYHDPLTGLPNRALLREHLDLALARARRNEGAVALLYLDLDDFKAINDSLGHGAGDDILRRVAARLRRRLRASDLLVRQGGDEFLLLLPDLRRAGAADAARAAGEAIRAALTESFEISGAEFEVGASVGISLYPDDAEDAETLLTHADEAMYEAKAAGRGGVTVYGGHERPVERRSLSSRLREAIAGGELVLRWQPIVALPGGEVIAAEALVRWHHPERGLLTPDHFLPFAEETGLIDRLGAWVADAVGAQRAEWRAAGLDLGVHINVSARQLTRRGFAGDLVKRAGAGGLTVEVTEAALCGDGTIERSVRELAARGVRVAVGGFGAAGCSPGPLRHLPLHAVKVDRSFLAGVPGAPDAAALIQAVRGVADALGLDAVAEGVETAAQRAFLVERGWTAAQGHLFGPPGPPAALGALLRGAGAIAG